MRGQSVGVLTVVVHHIDFLRSAAIGDKSNLCSGDPATESQSFQNPIRKIMRGKACAFFFIVKAWKVARNRIVLSGEIPQSSGGCKPVVGYGNAAISNILSTNS